MRQAEFDSFSAAQYEYSAMSFKASALLLLYTQVGDNVTFYRTYLSKYSVNARPLSGWIIYYRRPCCGAKTTGHSGMCRRYGGEE